MNIPIPAGAPTSVPNLPHPGTSTLLVGATGTGKTYCLRPLIAAGITPFVLTTEPGIESVLGDIPPDKLHWHYIPCAAVGWATLLAQGKRISTMSYEALSKAQDPDKRQYTQWLDVVTSCNQFICDRTGENFGDVATWGPDRAFIIDSLTGLNIMAMDTVRMKLKIESTSAPRIAQARKPQCR